MWKNKKHNISCFHHFEFQCFNLNMKKINKFDSRSDKNILVGYFETCKIWRAYNLGQRHSIIRNI